MRRVWIQAIVAPLVAACGLVGGIEDITIVPTDDVEGGQPIPRDEGGKPVIPDGSVPPDGAIDAGVDADAKRTQCNPLTPFGAPVAIAELNTASDDASPRLSPDELTVYLASDRPGHLGAGSIYTAKRAARNGT